MQVARIPLMADGRSARRARVGFVLVAVLLAVTVGVRLRFLPAPDAPNGSMLADRTRGADPSATRSNTSMAVGMEAAQDPNSSNSGVVDWRQRRRRPRRRLTLVRSRTSKQQRSNGNKRKAKAGGGTAHSSTTRPPPVSRPMNRARHVRFLHAHKAGGSSMCYMATQHRLASSNKRLQRNCNFYGDGPRTLAESQYGYGNVRRTCDQLDAQYVRAHASFAAIERWFDPSDVCPGYFYATLLRAPIPRIESHLSFHHRTFASVMSEVEKDVLHTRNDHYSPVVGSLAVNNFYVRTFAGGEANYMMRGSKLSDATLYAAMKTLRRHFHVVMILESDTKNRLLKTIPGFGGQSFVRKNQRAAKKKEEAALSEAQKELLTRHNQLDLEFYEYAKLLSDLQYTELLAQDASPGTNSSQAVDHARQAVVQMEKAVAQRAGEAWEGMEGPPRPS